MKPTAYKYYLDHHQPVKDMSENDLKKERSIIHEIFEDNDGTANLATRLTEIEAALEQINTVKRVISI